MRKTFCNMAVTNIFSTVALLLLALVENSLAVCKDYNSFVINDQTYNCETALDTFGLDFSCLEDVDLGPYLCCESCTPVPVGGKKLKAEGYFVLDHKSMEIFTKEANGDEKKGKEQLKEEAELIITNVNTYYDTLLPYGLDIDIYIAKLHILDFDLVSDEEIMDGDVVNKDVLLDNFEAWLKTKEAGSDTEYDFTMLLTGYDIEDPVKGYATKAGMCQRGRAFGEVEFRGLPDDAGLLAHEIGHIFGASHDPDNYLNVMAPIVDTDSTFDKYKFSDISADAINTYLSSARAASKCLFDTSSDSRLSNVQAYDYTGNSQDIYYLCERENGNGSLPCLYPAFYDFGYDSDGVCREIYCRDFPITGCWSMNPPEGLPCGAGKSCKKGYCEADPRPELANVDPNCPLGEDPIPTNEMGVTCEILISENGARECDKYSGQCCETCPKHETGITDCKYGDMSNFHMNGDDYDCQKALKDFGNQGTCQTNAELKDWCCKTCHDLGY